ncbi:collagen binding domain-containing protein [Ligilactobacillus sp.]|uniref:collagen binding domain-containing protein n=1 Tax=Ligilactobacillus sp. TaxID=2767921 RepID=UPI002FE2E9E8
MKGNRTFKKLVWLFGAMVAVFATVFVMGKFDGERADAAVELNQNNTVSFIDNVKIRVSHKDSTSEELRDDDSYTLKDGDKLSIEYDFSFPDDEDINPGDTYTVYVPKAFKAYNDCDGKLRNEDGTEFGTWKLSGTFDNDHNGYPLVMTFNDNIGTIQGRKGTIHLESSLDIESFSEENRQEIKIPLKDSTTYTIEIKQHTDEKFGDVTKNGWFLGNDWQPTRAHWVIDFNKGLNDIDDPVLKDSLYHADSQYSEHKIDYSSFNVYSVRLDSYGRVIEKSKEKVNPEEYEIVKSSDGMSYELHFKHKITGAYRIEYETDITNDSGDRETTKVGNKVSSYDGDKHLADASKELWAHWWSRGSTIVKKGVQKDGSRVDWTVYYNLVGHKFGDSTLLLDSLYSGTFDRNSFEIHEASSVDGNPFNQSENNIKVGRKLSESEYSISYSSKADREVAAIKIGNSNGKGYVISYRSNLPDGLSQGTQIRNHVEDGHDNEGEGSIWYDKVKEHVYKSHTNVTKDTIDWSVRFYEAASDNTFKTFKNLTLTDHFYTSHGSQLNLKGGLNAVKVYRSSGPGDWNANILVDSSEYTIKEDNKSGEGGYKGFKITFKGEAPAALYEVKYQTTRDSSQESGNWAQFGDEQTSDSVPADGGSSENIGISKSNSGVNRKDGLLYWKVEVNAEKLPMSNYMVKDTITGDQELVESTIKVKDVTENKDVTSQVRREIQETTSTYNQDGKSHTAPAKLLVIHLPDTDHQYEISYGVKLGPVGYNSDRNHYTDYADLYQGNDKKGSATNDYWHWKSRLEKDGAVDKNDNSLVNWTIDVNKAYITYPNGAIKDTLDGKQIFIEGSIEVYRYEGSDQWNDKLSSKPLPKSAYNVKIVPYTTSDGRVTQQMIITFNDDQTNNPGEKANYVSRPYRIKYQTKILTSGKDRVSNTASIEGLDNRVVYTKVDKDKEVTHTSGDATITGYNVDFDILKRDAVDKQVMRDVHFDLYRLADGKWIPYIQDVSTGSNGRISYKGLLTGRYKLVETRTQSGYTKLDTPVYFILSKKNMSDVKDKESSITLTDADGNKIEDSAYASIIAMNPKKNKPTTIQILNCPVGGMLPQTGGPGRLLFEALGSLLIVVACVLTEVLIWRRIRSSKGV